VLMAIAALILLIQTTWQTTPTLQAESNTER
jgi:hypothetical protein